MGGGKNTHAACIGPWTTPTYRVSTCLLKFNPQTPLLGDGGLGREVARVLFGGALATHLLI